MKKITNSILKYLIEFLIVAFGVFLGVYASELQNEKKNKAEKEQSINFIIEELVNNKNNLEKCIEYHQSIKTEIDSIAQTLSEKDVYTTYLGNKIFQHNKIKGWNGIQLANLENTAFETAKISGIIKEYDIEFIKNISKIYNQQENYSEFGASILNRMININSSTKIIDVFGSIQLMTTDLIIYEKTILNAIKKTQTEIKTPHNTV